MDGSEVDYVEGLQGAGFAVNNPNVVAACGCGQASELLSAANAVLEQAIDRFSASAKTGSSVSSLFLAARGAVQ